MSPPPPKDADREEKRRRALEFLDYIEKHPEEFRDIEGKTDVSVNHDKYLAEIYGTWKMIFVDTSALLALVTPAMRTTKCAWHTWKECIEGGDELITSNYVDR